MTKTFIWIERFGFFGILSLLIKSILSGYTICYSEHTTSSPIGKRLLALLEKCHLLNNFRRINISLEKIKPYDHTPYYQFIENLNICFGQFCDIYLSNEPASFKNMVKNYLSRSVLYERFCFITAIETEIALKGEIKKNRHILYIVQHPLNHIIAPFLTQRGFIIKESLNYKETVKFFIGPCYFIVAVLLSKIIPAKIKSNIFKVRPSIWVEYSPVDNFFDCTFWKQYVNTNNFDMVHYIDRNDTPIRNVPVKEIEKSGLRWIDAHSFSLIQMSKISLLTVMKYIYEIFNKSSSLPLWFKVFKFYYNFWLCTYTSIFKYYKVKVLIQHQDHFWRQEVQKKAIESSGGIMIGFHWSNYLTSYEPVIFFPYHVYFLWGKMIYDFVQKKDNICKYIIPSGLWIIDDKKRIEELNNLSYNLNFIINIFDSSTAYYLHQTPNTLSQFYLRILQLIENNPSWGVIVKSKNWGNLYEFSKLPDGNEIILRMHNLIHEKRLVILPGTISPPSLLSYANLSVCYGINSAGIIAGIHGHKAVHWDCSGWLKHPFYKDPNQKFIFETLDELEQAIIKASKGDKTIGDFSKWRQKLNYFDDFKAPERVGKFIQTFMDEVIRTDNMEHSLDFAVKRYSEENKIGEDFFKPEDWWDDELGEVSKEQC